ncbi:alanine racemase [Alkalicoccus urumqiensis]|uniref:Alanine racemase n=1 Tax=Alkalicoccus urumqiensis TaxID=1548213 RepID=A0A2P6MI08_ALKUR|nr:alanine racemase [Alkalicoccus urumqiensis]PRO65900.1 alanine racemase [Alkalicoccus urumqiensis]
MTFYRDTWAEVDLDAIHSNTKNLRGLLDENVQIMAVVKADGYGHKAVPTAEEALAAGAQWLGTALLDEAIALREAGITAPILVLGMIRPEDVVTAAANDIIVTAFQPWWLERAEKAAAASGQSFDYHIKIDSGMHRLGLKTNEEIDAFASRAASAEFGRAVGMFTHFAQADEQETSYVEEQTARFQEVADRLESVIGSIPVRHCANSAAAMRFPEAGFSLVRFGISMYGLTPSPSITADLPFALKPAFSLHSRITHVKTLEPGDTVSYGRTYTAESRERAATVPIGYADGWIRMHQGGDVLVNGQRCPIIGRICMDQMIIRVPEGIESGELVTLIGAQGSEYVSMEEAAARLDTINYEIPCVISARVPRLLQKQGRKTEVYYNIL